jgi:hypothetical protein
MCPIFVALGLAGALGACGDDAPAFGTRGDCAEGGAINDCPDPELTPFAVCEKLVACGVIVRDSQDNGNDYQECVNEIYRAGDNGTADFIMACIAASSCDQLQTDYCFVLGGN